MQFTNILAVAVLLAGSAFAAPVADAHPTHLSKLTKPERQDTSVVGQSNSCGNGSAPYCCDADGDGSYTSCKVHEGGSCSATTVCCNSNNSIQLCLGNVEINL